MEFHGMIIIIIYLSKNTVLFGFLSGGFVKRGDGIW